MRLLLYLSPLLAALSVHGACSSGGDGDGDGDADGDGDVDIEVTPPASPEAPAPPELPTLTPCPAGWREVPDDGPDGVTRCDPWPESGRQECATDSEAHFLGEPACSAIGTPCTASDWPAGLPDDAVLLHVQAGAAADGDGSEERPFATIAEAMATAGAGTIIALAKGSYDEAVRLAEGVTLWGACVAETTVTCSEPASDAGTITVDGPLTAVRNLRVGGERPGLWVDGDATEASVTLDGVLFQGCREYGLSLRGGASATGNTVVVRDTASRGSDGALGRGLHATAGAGHGPG